MSFFLHTFPPVQNPIYDHVECLVIMSLLFPLIWKISHSVFVFYDTNIFEQCSIALFK